MHVNTATDLHRHRVTNYTAVRHMDNLTDGQMYCPSSSAFLSSYSTFGKFCKFPFLSCVQRCRLRYRSVSDRKTTRLQFYMRACIARSRMHRERSASEFLWRLSFFETLAIANYYRNYSRECGSIWWASILRRCCTSACSINYLQRVILLLHHAAMRRAFPE